MTDTGHREDVGAHHFHLSQAAQAFGALGFPMDSELARVALAYGPSGPGMVEPVMAALVARVSSEYARSLIMSRPGEDLDQVADSALTVGSQWDIEHTRSDTERAWLSSWDVQLAVRSAAMIHASVNAGADVLKPAEGDMGTPDLLAAAIHTVMSVAGNLTALRLRDVAWADVPVSEASEAYIRDTMALCDEALDYARKLLATYLYPRTGIAPDGEAPGS